MAGRDIELISEGVRRLLQAPGVRADVLRRAERIAAAANASAGTEGSDKTRGAGGRFVKGGGRGFLAQAGQGANRARASVVTISTAARLAEARHRTLTRAIDAGR